MNSIKRILFASTLLVLAAPAYASNAVHIFACEIDDEVTEEQMESSGSKWLAAAKTMKGGANLKAFLHHPVAARMDKGDVLFVVVAPSLSEWGTFWDGYKGSAADKLDQENEDISCPDSALFEAVEIK